MRDYLWDQSGEPDPEIAHLEKLLGRLRYQAVEERLMNGASMKFMSQTLPKLICLSLFLVCLAVMPARGQGNARLQIDSLDRFASRATDTIEVNIDTRLLSLGGNFLSNKKAEESKVKELIAGLKGIYVKSYSFGSEGEFSTSDVQPIRQQLRAPGWSRIVGVTSKKEGNNTEVYLMSDGSRIGGLAVVSFEPKRLTVVNVVGSIDFDKLTQLEGQFGIPDLELERESKAPERK